MDKLIFGRFECACMMINLICAKLLFTAPRLFLYNSLTAVFAVLLCDFAAAGLIVFLFFRLMPDEELDIIDLAEKHLGRAGGAVAALSGAALLFTVLTTQPRIYAGFISDESGGLLSAALIGAALWTAAAAAAYMGVETVSRLHALFVPVCAAASAVLFSAAAPNGSVYHLFPVFGRGAEAVARDAFSGLSCFAEWFVVLMLFPHIRKKRLLRSSARAAFIISAILTALISVLYCAAVSAAARRGIASPALFLVQTARIFGRASRLDIYLIIIRSIAALLYTSCALFFFARCTGKLARLPDCRPITLPSAVFFFASGLLSGENAFIGRMYLYSPVLCWAAGFLLPLMLLFIIHFKAKRGERT